MSIRHSFRSCRIAALAAVLLLSQLAGLHHALAHRAALSGAAVSSVPAGQHAPTLDACLAYDAALQAVHLPTAAVRHAVVAGTHPAPTHTPFTSRRAPFAAHFSPRGPPAYAVVRTERPRSGNPVLA
jgi:hypothetical protein